MAERRAAWPKAKEIIFTTLDEIVKTAPAFDRRLIVIKTSHYRNLETVQMNFGNVPTGVVLEYERGFSAGMEHGAAIVFGQSESGIVAVERYPFRTELPRQGDRMREPEEFETIAALEPELIDRDQVLTLATDFFRWAVQTTIRQADAKTKAQIGFRAPMPIAPPGDE